MAVKIGLDQLHWALLTEDTLDSLIYQTPVPLVGAISANINPNTSSETLFADDGPMETATTIGNIELELNVADIPLATYATWLGHQIVGGVVQRKSSDVPPWVAIGFRSLKSDGSYKYLWLVKGKFREPEMSHETKGESVAFQPPTIVGSFVKRDHDGIWCLDTDSNYVDVPAATITNWFVTVGGASDTTAPTVTATVPADGADNVAKNANITVTFSKAIDRATILNSNIVLFAEGAGTPVDVTLTYDDTTHIVTVNPDSDLVGTTEYILIITTGIKDLAGNALEAPVVRSFTTVS